MRKSGKIVMIAPTLIYILCIGIFPLVFSVYLVFHSWQPGVFGMKFIGLGNLENVLHDARFWNSLTLTLIFLVVAISVEFFIGLGLALVLRTKIKGTGFFRIFFVMPMLLSPVAVAFSWKMLFHFGRGPINFFLSVVKIASIEWLGSASTALPSVMIADIWQWTPFMILALLAALEALPVEFYEAALVDGGSSASIFWYISLPLLGPVIISIILLRTIDAFKIFDLIYILTGGGPGSATEVTNLYAYVSAFRSFNMGYASAMAWIQTGIVIIAFTVLINSFRKLGVR